MIKDIEPGTRLPIGIRVEVAGREMVMEGVLAIQSGQNPRVIEETLLTYLPPAEAAELLDQVPVP